jgi:hypothetical protein
MRRINGLNKFILDSPEGEKTAVIPKESTRKPAQRANRSQWTSLRHDRHCPKHGAVGALRSRMHEPIQRLRAADPPALPYRVAGRCRLETIARRSRGDDGILSPRRVLNARNHSSGENSLADQGDDPLGGSRPNSSTARASEAAVWAMKSASAAASSVENDTEAAHGRPIPPPKNEWAPPFYDPHVPSPAV